MSEATKSPAKKKPASPKKPADHPPYVEMIKAAITALKERSGSSRQAIEKYIKANYKVGEVGSHLEMALKRGTASDGACRIERQKIGFGSYVDLFMYRIQCISYANVFADIREFVIG